MKTRKSIAFAFSYFRPFAIQLPRPPACLGSEKGSRLAGIGEIAAKSRGAAKAGKQAAPRASVGRLKAGQEGSSMANNAANLLSITNIPVNLLYNTMLGVFARVL